MIEDLKDSEDSFNFDLGRMKTMVESPSIEVPYFETFEEFKEWFEAWLETV